MKKLVDFIQNAVKTGESITLAYGGGSRPGQARQLIIASTSETDFRAYENGSNQSKQYKIAKILWAKNNIGLKVTNDESVMSFESATPRFGTLQEYANFLSPDLETAGWHIYHEHDMFGVGTKFKNGQPKKTPSIAVIYIDRTDDVSYDFESNSFVDIKKELTGRERPWRVDSWRFKEGKSFGLLHTAVELLMDEIKASNPLEAKGMFAGH
jgi:hypothetical protein